MQQKVQIFFSGVDTVYVLDNSGDIYKKALIPQKP